MAPALQQWMAVVLGLLLLRSEAFQVIYAMRSQPQQQQEQSPAKNWPQAARAAGSVLPPQHLLLDFWTVSWTCCYQRSDTH